MKDMNCQATVNFHYQRIYGSVLDQICAMFLSCDLSALPFYLAISLGMEDVD